MYFNQVICGDCNKAMKANDLHSLFCIKANVFVKIEESICLYCSSRVLLVVDVVAAGMPEVVGRTESVEVTCLSEMPPLALEQSALDAMALSHFLHMMQHCCITYTGQLWYAGFEVELWQVVHNIKKVPHLKLSAREILTFKTLSKNLNTWIFSDETKAMHALQDVKSKSIFIDLDAWIYTYQVSLKKTNHAKAHPRGGSEIPGP